MANAALYNLLVLNDKDQEALLINNTSLLENIKIIKQNNIRKLDQEIFGIRKNLLKLQNQLLTIVDNVKFEEIKIKYKRFK
jgi:hypothetical protein